jgi:RNA polymerase sigma factor for flagellar operon FliA
MKIEENQKTKLLLQYKDLVWYVIKNKFPITLPEALEYKDLFFFGVEGLSEAIDRFDPDFGTKFETYAIPRIRGKIIDEVRKTQIKPRANYQNQDPNKVVYRNISIDQQVKQKKNSNSDEGTTIKDTLVSNAKTPFDVLESNEIADILNKIMVKLTDREKIIIKLYYWEGMRMNKIAPLLGISLARASQIHANILKKMKMWYKKNDCSSAVLEHS